MHAIGSFSGLPSSDPDSLVDVDVPRPTLKPNDILVAVEAVSVNPVDVKVRAGLRPSDTPKIVGWDASGTVVEIGSAVEHFAIGDRDYYAGDVTRQGSNAELQAVDERIVGHAPASLSFAEAAAMPLTTIVAFETLFDRLRLTQDSSGTLLALAAAGGTGSILAQVAKKLTGLQVIGTASSDASQEFARRMGADHVVDHHGELAASVLDIVAGGVDYVFSSHTRGQVKTFAQLMRPLGQIVVIDEVGDESIDPLKSKSISWHWESMFARPTTGYDIGYQGELLDTAAALFDDGTLVSTLTTTLDGFTATNLREAHRLVETGKTIGKVVVTR